MILVTAKVLRLDSELTARGERSDKFVLVMFALAAMLFAMFLETLFSAPQVTLLVYCLFVGCIAFRDSVHIMKYLIIYFDVTANILGVFVLESSQTYLWELDVYSFYAGSLPLLTLAQSTFLGVLYLLDKGDENLVTEPPMSNRWVKIALVASVCLIAAGFACAVSNPFFSTESDRFEYRSLGTAQQVATRIVTLCTYLTPIALMGYKQGNRRLGVLFLILLLITGFCTGNKFGLFILIGNLVILGLLPRLSCIGRRRMRKTLLGAAIFLVALIGVVMVHNGFTMGYTSLQQNVDYLNMRLAQQGQLWWRTYEMTSGDAPHFEDFPSEIDAWFNNNADPATGSYGVYKIMYLTIATKSLFYTKVFSGSAYAYSTQASLYYYFGAVGLVLISLVMALLYGVLLKSVTEAINRERILESVILIRLLVLANGVVMQSAFQELFSWKVLAYLVVYFLLVAIRRRKLYAYNNSLFLNNHSSRIFVRLFSQPGVEYAPGIFSVTSDDLNSPACITGRRYDSR